VAPPVSGRGALSGSNVGVGFSGRDRGSNQGQGPRQAAGSAAGGRGRVGVGRPSADSSGGSLTSWIEQPPGHCPNPIKEFECGIGSGFVDGAGLGEESKVDIDFFG